MTWDEAFDLSRGVEEIDAADIDPENVWTPDEIEEEAEQEFLREVNAHVVDWALEELSDLDEKTMFDHYGYEEDYR